jgi:DNA-binding transcriptional regulator YiaG
MAMSKQKKPSVASTGAERQKRFKAKHQTVSLSVRRTTADQIRKLREAASLTTEVILARALGLLEAALVTEKADIQKMTGAAPKATSPSKASSPRRPRTINEVKPQALPTNALPRSASAVASVVVGGKPRPPRKKQPDAITPIEPAQGALDL